MPHVIVKLWPGQSEQQKRRLAAAITKDVASVLNYGDESVQSPWKKLRQPNGARRSIAPTSWRRPRRSTRSPDTKCRPADEAEEEEGIESCEEQFSTVRATCASTIVRTHASSTRQTPSSGCRRPASAARISGPIGVSTPASGPAPMGHEYCGIVEEVGRAVTSIKPGQFVIGSFAASDNTCSHCRAGYQTSCAHRQWVTGAQAPFLRVPMADGTLVATQELPSASRCPASWRCRTSLYRVVRGRRGQRQAGCDGRRGGRWRCRSARRAVGETNGRRADHRDEPPRSEADAGARIWCNRHRDRARRRRRRARQGTDQGRRRGFGARVCRHARVDDAGDPFHATGGSISYVGVPHGVELDGAQLFYTHVHLHGGPAPVRRYLPALIQLVQNGTINPGKVFDLKLPLEQAAEGYRAMDERRAIKTLLRP